MRAKERFVKCLAEDVESCLRPTSHEWIFNARQFHCLGGCLKGMSSHKRLFFLSCGAAAAVHRITITFIVCFCYYNI